MPERTYIAIDLKSFYASVECVARQLDPLTTCLVVADESRTDKTICLAVSPALKSVGIPGRPRLFEVVRQVAKANQERKSAIDGREFVGKSYDMTELTDNCFLELEYVIAPPRMAKYLEVSAEIYSIYLKYVATEDIHIYSIDEVFIDATSYLKLYGLTARQFTEKLIHEVLEKTGITATAGIGTNLYLCKIAMDIVAKHMPADRHGARVAELDEAGYRRQLWTHQPLTDFWRVGPGYAAKLEAAGLRTMGDIARISLKYEDLLYRLFGVNAELLIDHAWGWESATMADIKNYRTDNHSLCSGQVLSTPYDFDHARIVALEMADSLAVDMTSKRLVANRLELAIGYDTVNISDSNLSREYSGKVRSDRYGRKVPEKTHGALNLERFCATSERFMTAIAEIFDRVADRALLVRRLNITACHVIPESEIPTPMVEQPDLFASPDAGKKRDEANAKDNRLQRAVADIKKKFGKNAILRGLNLLDGATAVERNGQIGGHRK